MTAPVATRTGQTRRTLWRIFHTVAAIAWLTITIQWAAGYRIDHWTAVIAAAITTFSFGFAAIDGRDMWQR